MSISAHLSLFGLGLSINEVGCPNLSIGPVHVWLGRSPLFGLVWLGKFDFVVEWMPTPGDFFRLETYRTSPDSAGGSFLGCQWRLVTGAKAAARI